MKRVCKKCGIEKDISLFAGSRYYKYGRKYVCAECYRQICGDYVNANRQRIKERLNVYYHKHKDEYNKKRREDYHKNIELSRLKCRESALRYKEVRRGYVRQYMKNNTQARLARNLRRRISKVINNVSKGGRLRELLGCEIDFFKNHIESLWLDGMSWDNYGGHKGEWCIDHIKPLASFDLLNKEESRKAFHWSNCRPMWALENYSKNSCYNGVRYRYK